MMDKSKSGIYRIVHTKSGKLYVGSAKHIGRRWIEHVRDLRAGQHVNRKLQNAWNKYGADAFAFSILEVVASVDLLIEREQFWLDATQAVKRGYNLNPTAGSALGAKHSDATRKKMSQAHKGKERSPEHRQSLSLANKGKKMSEEAKQKMRDAKLGTSRPSHSGETKEKMSAAAKGRQFSEETRKKMALAKIGRVIPESVRAKMSKAHKARRATTSQTKTSGGVLPS